MTPPANVGVPLDMVTLAVAAAAIWAELIVTVPEPNSAIVPEIDYTHHHMFHTVINRSYILETPHIILRKNNTAEVHTDNDGRVTPAEIVVVCPDAQMWQFIRDMNEERMHHTPVSLRTGRTDGAGPRRERKCC